MRINFYGVRGSCPAPGASTAGHGGNTSCVAARLDDGTLLIFDAGTGIRTLGKELAAEKWRGAVHLLLSHTHWDHIIGLPFFDPLWWPATRLIIHPLTNDKQERFRWRPTIFDEIHFPVPAVDIPCKVELADHSTESNWEIGEAKVSRIRLNHPGGAQGFKIETGPGRVFCYLTDNEISPPGEILTPVDKLADFARGADVVVHDAQYIEEDFPMKHGWGHSLISDVLKFGADARPKKLILFHHDPDRDDEQLRVLEAQSQAWMNEHAPGTEVINAHEGLEFTLPLE